MVGGVKAGPVENALLAVFVPGVMIGVMVAVGVTYLADVYWGVLAGLGGVALSFLNIGPLLLGAVVGGLTAHIWTGGTVEKVFHDGAACDATHRAKSGMSEILWRYANGAE